MNIEDLTLRQIKEIAAMANSQQCAAKPESRPHPFIGKHVIARCYSAGVHAGIVVSVDGDTAILKDSRRLWSWKAQDGIALSWVAQNGIKPDSKIDSMNPEIYLNGIAELIPTSATAQVTINGK